MNPAQQLGPELDHIRMYDSVNFAAVAEAFVHQPQDHGLGQIGVTAAALRKVTLRIPRRRHKGNFRPKTANLSFFGYLLRKSLHAIENARYKAVQYLIFHATNRRSNAEDHIACKPASLS